MADTITLNNVSFRVVGTFMRVNQPYTAVPAPGFVPFTVEVPQLTIAQPPTVGAFMDALVPELASQGLDFGFGDLPAPTRPGTLDFVSYGPSGGPLFELSAQKITKALQDTGEFVGPKDLQLGVAWQYYVFYKTEDTSNDTRVEVAGRARYRESVMLQDNCRVIWRLITTYLNPNDGKEKQFVKANGVEQSAAG
ncbi:MAG: hypothetical protein AAFN94_13935 [Pseudomonadota bacterium]